MLASLTDPELAPHIDRTRISILGWSSGGNLACKKTLLFLVNHSSILTNPFNSCSVCQPAARYPPSRHLGRGSLPTL